MSEGLIPKGLSVDLKGLVYQTLLKMSLLTAQGGVGEGRSGRFR